MSKDLLSDLIQKSYWRRRWKSRVMTFFLGTCALIALAPLFSVFYYALAQGLSSINWAFFTELPKPVGEKGGGMANAILGTGMLVGLASLLGIPWGMSIGLYLSEYSHHKGASIVRFVVDLLASIPSIVVGLFAYTVAVLPFKQFSAIAGGLALGILMIPTIARSTEEILKLVPNTIREAGLALGLPRWKVVLRIVLSGSIRPIFTGIILALARVAGETAPLLFTAFNNQYWPRDLFHPVSSLPVQIYTYAISPFEDWHRQAWAGALTLIFWVFLINILTRILIPNRIKERT